MYESESDDFIHFGDTDDDQPKRPSKPQKSLRARAMDILSRQEISRVGLKRKLAPHAESEEELEKVLAEFAERNWQSDKRYAAAKIHSKRHQKGVGRNKEVIKKYKDVLRGEYEY